MRSVLGHPLAAGLLLCDAIRGRTLSEAAAVMPTFPQVKENLPLRGTVPQRVFDEVERINAELDGTARVLVRASGTEPVVRLLAEAQTEEEARRLSDTIANLVRDSATTRLPAAVPGGAGLTGF
jgi:phosphoglucosamine mutase